VFAVIDNIGPDSWVQSLSSLTRGGTLVVLGATTEFDVPLNLLPIIADQLTITGSIMGTLDGGSAGGGVRFRGIVEPRQPPCSAFAGFSSPVCNIRPSRALVWVLCRPKPINRPASMTSI
jgi:NADPH:quinone reductase-like Zn-dependent oxidoreductase